MDEASSRSDGVWRALEAAGRRRGWQALPVDRVGHVFTYAGDPPAVCVCGRFLIWRFAPGEDGAPASGSALGANCNCGAVHLVPGFFSL